MVSWSTSGQACLFREKPWRSFAHESTRHTPRGARVLGEVIRFYMCPWIQAEHPDWQDINSPGGKPITVAKLKDNAVLGCWNSPNGDWFIKSQVELIKRLDWEG